MRRAARRDANEPEIFACARRIGLRVYPTNELADAVVQYGTQTELWEVKMEHGRLTKAQIKNRERGLHARTVRTTDDVFAAKAQMMVELGKLRR